MLTIKKLNELVEEARKENQRKGQYGIEACKESAMWHIEKLGRKVEELYISYVEKIMKTFPLANINMIVAVEELAEELKEVNA